MKTLLGFHELKNAPLLIFANKQDLKSAIDPVEMNEKLGLHSNCNCDLNNDRNWYIQKACATTGDGLHEGLYWLSNQLNNRCEIFEVFLLSFPQNERKIY